jgi:hypothetical protein
MPQYDIKSWSITKRLYLHGLKRLACSRKILDPLPAIKLRVKWARHFTNAGHEIDLQKPVCCGYLNSTFATRSLRTGWQVMNMAYAPRPTAVLPSGATTGSSLRQPSVGSQNAQQSSALAARIAAKRSELENLKQLKELSGALATQMVALEEKLATLRDGTEGLARPGCTRNYMPIS